MMPKNIYLSTSGLPTAPRICIMDNDHNYWSEMDHCWTTDPTRAALYLVSVRKCTFCDFFGRKGFERRPKMVREEESGAVLGGGNDREKWTGMFR